MSTWVLTAGLILFIVWDLLMLGLQPKAQPLELESRPREEALSRNPIFPVEVSTLIGRN